MANRGCASLKLDESKYSSPMPLIGLYIAAGSLLCFLAMLFDILSAFRHKKRWLPCRLFALNSVTLTLLAIAGKLPVDLTSSMPSTLDQFSKLSGMAFICISMGFLVPSLGMSGKSECISNMIALSIMIVTVIVNICIQFRTRVIVLFVTEHIIIMVCILGLLVVLWFTFAVAAIVKSYSLDNNKDILRRGSGSMLERLKLAYLYGFDSNPQFFICKSSMVGVAAGLCMVCSVVLVQAAFRNLAVDFCEGKSDYVWSMWVIVAVQTLTVVVGCVATVFRWAAIFARLKPLSTRQSLTFQATYDIYRQPELRFSLKGRCKAMLWVPLSVVGPLCYILAYLPFMLVLRAARVFIDPLLKSKYEDDEDIKEYQDLVGEDGLEEWVVVKSVKEMKNWMKSSGGYSPNNLVKLLSEIVPSREENSAYLERLNVSTLSLALISRIAQVSLPAEDPGQSLLQAYSEASEILHFIEDRTTSMTSHYVYYREISKAVRRGKGFGYLFTEVSETDPLRRALWILNELKSSDIGGEIREEYPSLEEVLVDSEYLKQVVHLATFFIRRHPYSSIEDLSQRIQQVFVDMIHAIFAQLPHAICCEVLESTAEDFDQSIRRSLEVLCQVEFFQHSIQWWFPGGSGISRLWPEHHEEPINRLEDSIPSQAFV